MTPFKAYIAGPMTGLPNFNRPAFFEAAEKVRSLGYKVWNPADCRDINFRTDLTWPDYIRRAIKALADCDLIVLLPGWSYSKGAILEHHIAKTLGMPRVSIEDMTCVGAGRS